MPTFAIIGLGYIAPRHLQAIHEVGGTLVIACDTHDCGGILDKYFPDCAHTVNQDYFFYMCQELQVDYVVICTPNLEHYGHIMQAIEAGCKVICEKPLCTNATLAEKLLPYNERIFTILQMRLHPEAKRMKQELSTQPGQVGHLTYTTPRGQWYANSWKSNPDHGGLLLNIGVHCMDLLLHTFGPVKGMSVTPVKREATAMGFLHFENISMNYWLSTNAFTAERSIAIHNTKNEKYDFTNGFTDLHTESYREILAGRGFTVAEALPAIQLIDEIKKLQINPA